MDSQSIDALSIRGHSQDRHKNETSGGGGRDLNLEVHLNL